MSRDTFTILKSKTSRRIVAVLCIMCIAVLQCFVVMPALSDGVHAEGGLSLHGYNSKIENSKTFEDSIDSTIEALLDKAGVTTSDVKTITSDIGDLKKTDKIRKVGSEYFIIDVVTVPVDPDDPEAGEEQQEQQTRITSIDFEMKSSYSPIKKLYVNSINNLKTGESKTLKYGTDYGVKKGDDFFKEEYPKIIDVSVEGAKNPSSDNESVSFTAGKSGSTISVTVKDTLSNIKENTNVDVVSKTLKVSPSSLKLKVGESAKVTVKDDNGTVSSNLTWKSSSSKIAKVSGGTITGVKKGSATITVKDKTSGLSAKVSVTVSEKATQKTTTRRYSSYRATGYTYRPYRPTTRSGVTGRTGSTVTTTATRPTQTGSTAAPSFQTMKVKEVYLTETIPEETQYYDENGNPIDEDEYWDEEEGVEEDYDEDGVSFPAAAGSAAVAVAACGAGAVGRVRKFNLDMGKAVAAAVTGKAADGGKKRAGAKTKAGASAKADAPQGEDKSRNPLKKFRKK